MDISSEPMDIDLSSNSIKKIDVSNCDSEEPASVRPRTTSPLNVAECVKAFIKQEPIDGDDSRVPVDPTENTPSVSQTVKKYHIIMQRKRIRKKSNLVFKFSFVFALIAMGLIYYVNIIDCFDEVNVSLVKDTLLQKVYGQNRAIDLLVKALEVRASSKILFMYGGTGVGKTYTVSIILEKAWNASNVYHYIMPMFLEKFPNDLLLGMSFCKSSILIVDDLKQHDFNIIDQLENVVMKSEYLKKNITIMLIYNLDKVGTGFIKNSDAAFFELELKENFAHIDAYKEYIKFESLNEDHLKMCIKSEFQSSNVDDMEQLLKNFNVTLDGCKSVHSKLKYLSLIR